MPYRLLRPGEIVQQNDEVASDNLQQGEVPDNMPWVFAPCIWVGEPVNAGEQVRRMETLDEFNSVGKPHG